MKPAAKFALFIALLILLKPFTTTADEIILKGGGIVQGTIVDQNDENIVVMDVDGVSSTVPINDVERTVRSVTKGEPIIQESVGENANEKVELVLQNGHIDSITSVVFSPNGRSLATGGRDGAVKIWSVESGELIYSLGGHSHYVEELAFSPDGNILASGSAEEVKAWSTRTGKLLYTKQFGPSLYGYTPVFSPDGELIAVSGHGGDSNITLMYSKTGEILHTLKCESLNFDCSPTIFSPDGNIIATTWGKHGGEIGLWSAYSGELIHIVQGDIKFSKFTADGKSLLSGNWDKTINLWSLDTGELVHSYKGDWFTKYDRWYDIDRRILSNNGMFFIVEHGNEFDLWSLKTGELIFTISEDPYSDIVFSPDDNFLTFASDKNASVHVYSVQTGEYHCTFSGHSGKTNVMAYSPNSELIATGDTNGNINIWTTNEGKLLHSLSAGRLDVYTSIAFNPNGNSLVAAGGRGKVQIWSFDEGKLKYSMVGHIDPILSTAISPDGALIASGGYDETIKVWSAITGNLLYSLDGHKEIITSVAFSIDGKSIATGSCDNTIKLWSTETGELLHSYEGHSDCVTSATFSSDGKYIVSGSYDKTAKVWSLQTGKVEIEFEHSAYVNAAIISNNGKYIATIDGDGYAKLWSFETGELLKSFVGHTANIYKVVFSPNDEIIATGSHDHTIKIWSIKSGELIWSFNIHTGEITKFERGALGFSLDGNIIAAGSWGDQSVKLWSVETGDLIHCLTGHSNYVDLIQFSPNNKFIATGSWDGTIKIWNFSTGQLLATLIAFNDGNWFVQDSAGRFDCSGCERGDPNSGKKYIRWRGEDNTLYAPDQFFRKFYEPGLLADVVKMGFVAPVEGVGSMDDALRTPPPEVAFDSPGNMSTVKDETIEVKVRVSEVKGGGVENVRLFVNGRPVADPPRDATPAGAPAGERVFAFTAPLTAGENHIMALATSRSGIDSRQAEITVTADIPAQTPDLYLVTIGIDEYANKNFNLGLAVADADGFADEFITGGAGLYAQIHDIRLRNADATGDNLRRTLEDIQNRATFNDVVIVFYAGHGVNMGGGWYLMTHEIMTTSEENITQNAFSDLELKAFLKRVKAGKVVLVIDACYSGAVPQMLTHGISKDKFMVQLAYGSGASVMAASTDSQKAQETSDLGHGVFTYFLLDGLIGKADGFVANTTANNTIEVRELGQYTVEQVPEYLENNLYREQTPFFWQAVDGPGASLVAVP